MPALNAYPVARAQIRRSPRRGLALARASSGGSGRMISCCARSSARGSTPAASCASGGESGVALILVEASGENVIVVAPGANARLTPGDVEVGEADAVICQLEIPIAAVVAAAAQGAVLLLERGPRPRRRSSSSPICSSSTATSTKPIGPRGKLVALTLGAEGAVLLEDGREVARATPPRGGRGRRHRGG